MLLRCVPVVIMLFTAVAPVFSAARVSQVMGDVSLQQAGTVPPAPLLQGAVVATGDVISTGDRSFAELMAGKHVVTINAGSRVRLSKSMVDDEESDSLSLFFGALVAKISKLGKGDRGFVVETPSALCAVRGTEFTVASGHDGQTLVQVLRGSVALRGQEREVVIGKNQESSVTLGGEPTGVTRLTKKAWDRWIARSRQGMQGNELAVLRGALDRMTKLGCDIETMEGLHERFAGEERELQARADGYAARGMAELHREYSARAHRARRAAMVALNTAFYKAEKLDLIRGLAEGAYESLKEKAGEGSDARERIEEIFKRNEERYIKKIRTGDSLREKIREKRRR
jgi:hypothetical protein